MFAPLISLSELSLQYNDLGKALNIRFDMLYQLENVKILNLASNNINQLPAEVFSKNKHLTHLVLGRNALDEIPSLQLGFLTDSLETLDLSDNPIATIPRCGFGAMKKLKMISLNSMPVLSIIEGHAFCELLNLEVVELEYNVKLEELKDHTFWLLNGSHVPHLHQVSLRGNKLSTLDEDLLPWEQIHTLDLAGNPWYCNCKLRWIKRLPITNHTLNNMM